MDIIDNIMENDTHAGVPERKMKRICYVMTISSTVRSFFIPQMKYLADNEFEVSVICSDDDFLQMELGNNLKFIPVDIPRGLSVCRSVKAVWNLIQVFKNEKFDLIQYSTPNAALCSSIAARIVKCKIRNYHLMGFRYLGEKGIAEKILKILEKITCKLSTSIECVSESNLQFGVAEKIFPKNKATVVWNGSTGGIDLSKFNFSKRIQYRNQIRNEKGLNERDFVFGFVGRITKDKGIDELLEAFFNLPFSSKLMIVGNPEGISTINQTLWNRALQDENIIILDSKQDIEKYYAAIDVLILPSYREGFGNVVIEAAAMGTPAIVTDISGPIDAIEYAKTGITVKKRNSEDLCEKMKIVIKNNPFKTAEYCSNYVKKHFDSSVLNEHILERKRYLLND